ncbi:MAG: potassium channel family protein [Methylocella sp.]
MLSIIWMAIIFYSDACVKLGVRDTTNKDDPDSITHDRYVCVYYSVITFTTVGYGDFVPSKDLRAVAATEALTGYFFLAMLMTCLSQVLNLFVANRTSEIIK